MNHPRCWPAVYRPVLPGRRHGTGPAPGSPFLGRPGFFLTIHERRRARHARHSAGDVRWQDLRDGWHFHHQRFLGNSSCLGAFVV